MNGSVLKTCRSCKRSLAFKCFYAHPHGKYGVDSQCKECKKAERGDRTISEAQRKADTLSKRKYTQKARSIPLADRPPVKRLKCVECLETKRVSAFRIDLAFKSGYSSRCAKCTRSKSRERYNATPTVRGGMKIARDKYRKSPHGKLKELDYIFQKKYGISVADYHAMLAAQNGACALCLEVPDNKRLGVDHDHQTGRVRGLLCTKCNSGLERVDSIPDFLERAAAYLKNPIFDQVVSGREPLISEAVN